MAEDWEALANKRISEKKESQATGPINQRASVESSQPSIEAQQLEDWEVLANKRIKEKGIGGLEPSLPRSQSIFDAKQSISIQPRKDKGRSNNEGSIFDLFTGNSKATPEIRSLKEIGAAPELNEISLPAFKASLGLLLTGDSEKSKGILKKQFGDKADFREDKKGNLIVDLPSGSFALNQPGLSAQDAARGAFNLGAFIPAGILSQVPKSVAARLGIGGALTGATELELQEERQKLGGGEVDLVEVGVAGVLGAVAEGVGPAVKAFRRSREAKGLEVATKELQDTINTIKPGKKAVEEIEKLTGVKVGLFKAQQTQQPSTLMKQRLLPGLDAGAKKSAKALEQQNKEVFDATSELLNTIAGPEVVETGTARFRTAAQKAIEAAKERRRAATSGLYSQALKEGASVDIKSINQLIKKNLSEAPKAGKFRANMQKLSSLINSGEKKEAGKILSVSGQPLVKSKSVPPSLKKLQKAKFEIDEMLEAFGENSLGATTKRKALEIKNELVNQMEKASPLYKQANAKFREMSPAVTQLEDSIIGAASKFKDVDLQNISRRVFGANSNPFAVKNAKRLIDKAEPGAWDDMLRVELQRRLGGTQELAADIPEELIGNIPGQIRRKLFGNPEQRRTLLAAMNSEQRKNFVYLDEVLRRASSGRAIGSPTAEKQEAIKQLKGAAATLRDFIFRPFDSLQKTGEGKLFNRNVAALTEVLFNPKWEPKLREMRKAAPQSKKAETIFSKILQDAIIIANATPGAAVQLKRREDSKAKQQQVEPEPPPKQTQASF